LVAAAKKFVPVHQEILCLYEDLKTIPQPSERPSIDQIISEIESSNWYIDQIVDRRTVEAKEARTGIVPKYQRATLIHLILLPGSLHPPMSQMISNAVLHSRNIYSLYSHQISAIESIRRGKHVVVSTSTASGKSVIYQVDNLFSCLNPDPSSTLLHLGSIAHIS
jgi:DEAD/DEAH box helicase domain-containing protein